MLQLIIGHVTTNSVKIWVRGKPVATAAVVELQDNDTPVFHQQAQLVADDYNTATVVAEGLRDNLRYDCIVHFDDGTVVRGLCKTLPVQADSFNFLLASCHLCFGTERSSPEFGRINWVAGQEQSRFMIGCGDQIYIDTIFPGLGVKSRDDYRQRYEQTWASPEVAQVFGTLPQYMIVDDHEIYNNFVNANLNSRQQELLDWAVSSYRIFQHAHNPDTESVFYYNFSCCHADFFVMDLRTERTATQMISDTQFGKLLDWLNTRAVGRIKFIISSVPLFTQVGKVWEKDKWSEERYISQRNQLIELLMQSDHKRVIILSGDIHLASHAEISYEQAGQSFSIHELISSPIKQTQLPLLSSHPSPVIDINGTSVAYALSRHMGGPVVEGESHVPLVNNFMSISVSENAVHYKVYAANSEELLFEDDIFF